MGFFDNLTSQISNFRQFQQNFKGNPEEQVQQMLNSGQMTQEQLNQILPVAQQFYQMLHGGK